MSLTNPKNVITEERLSEFYQQILPYLGGMPDILANKFNKSDLYSTDEKIIGQWIDGKPLYQKTLSPVTVDGGTDRAYVNISDLTSLNIDTFIDAWGRWIDSNISKPYAVSDQNQRQCLTYNQTTKYLQLLQVYGANSMTGFITIVYTKTTDSPVSIGSDTDYSTTEKIVGTWIDGKPIYQKTIDFGTMPNSDYKTMSVSDLNIGLCVNIWGIAYKSDGSANPLPFVNANHPSSNQTSDASLAYDGDNKVIGVRTYLNYTNRDAYITLQYTKTS